MEYSKNDFVRPHVARGKTRPFVFSKHLLRATRQFKQTGRGLISMSRRELLLMSSVFSEGHPDFCRGRLINKDLAAFDLQLYIFGGILWRAAILPQDH